MKKILATLMLSLAVMSSFAEATFDQIEGLIQQKNYAAAASGLEVIIQNHPKSAKAFYAMAQAQAGLGNLEKANKALNIATGLNPTLDFAPASSVQSLKQAITPQTAKIESIEESHFWRNFVMGFILAGAIVWVVMLYVRKSEAEAAKTAADKEAEYAKQVAEIRERERQRAAEAAKTAKAEPAVTPKTEERLYKDAKASPAYSNPVPQPVYTQPAPAPAPTVIHTNSGSNDLLTGILVGNMISGHSHHHDTTRVVEREVVREVPAAPTRSSTWDDTPAPSTRSSTWDDTPSTPSRSSSWDDSSSSSSSSSWSSSSSSDSSSSWDSGSSSSDSSSSWD